jgi:hypothetical protein
MLISAQLIISIMKKSYALLAGSLLAISFQTHAQTKVGGPGAPDNSAMLEVTGGAGNNKGLLAPRLTTAQRDAIVNPATALMIYNTTTNQLQVNTGTPAAPIWTSSSVSNAWSLAGNAGTNIATNYLGTSDNQPLVFRTNAAEHLRITTTGNIGINNGAPLVPLAFASTEGPKISLYDAGSATENYGFGITGGRLNYHVMTGGSHQFYVGGKNGNGTELMRIQGDGNVGVGTNAPSAKLHVNGTARITGSAGTPTAITGRDASGNIGNIALGTGLSLASGVLSASGGSPGWSLTGNAGINPATNYIGTTDAQPLLLRTNAAERFRITPTGNIGISNPAPLVPLAFASVVGAKLSFFDSGANDHVGFGVSSNQFNYHTVPGADHAFFAGGKNGDGTELVRIQGGGNVGIGTNAPSTKLHVNGGARITGSSGTPTLITGRDASGNIGNIALGAGLSLTSGVLSASGASSGWSLTGNAGINPATNYIGTTDAQPLLLRTNAAERFRITPTGNIGISNPAPLVPLAFASVVGAKLSFFDSGANDHVGFGVSSNQFNYHTVPGADHAFFAGGKNGDGTELFRILGNGNVGIGTNAPGAKLDVNGTARIAGSAGTATAITGRDGAGNVSNITLGANLSLAGGVLSASGGGASGWGLTGNAATNPATNYLGTSDAQPLVMRTNAAERMRILADGTVSIGTATPHPSAKLDVNLGNMHLSPRFGIRWAENDDAERIYMYPALGLPGNNLYLESREHMVFITDRNNTRINSNDIGFVWATNGSWLDGNTPTEWMRLTDMGRLGIGVTLPAYKLDVAGDINASASVRANGVVLTSDARLKRNISNTKHGLSTIMSLNPVEYDKKQTISDSVYANHEIGFVAQEIAKVLPSLVKEGNDVDKTLAVSYTELIPVLTKAIQEQQAQIELLKAANKKLKDGQAVTAQLVERVKQMEQMLGVKGTEGISRAVSK